MKKGNKFTKKRSSPLHRSQQRIFEPTNAYLLGNIPYLFMCKWGITDKTKQRTANVDETTDGVVFCIASCDLLYGWECEQLVHRLYSAQNVVLSKGSGRTEWFLNISPIALFLSILFTVYVTGDVLEWWQYLTILFTPVIWLDGLIWLIVFYSGKVLAVLSVIALFVYAIAHMV